MRKQIFLLLTLISFIVYNYRNSYKNTREKTKTQVSKLLEIAKSFEGTTYKAGGITNAGMDCSGLLTTVFKNSGVKLPRSSVAMSAVGEEIVLSDVKKGDLLFFNIERLKGAINHVGLVVNTDKEVEFIHATTSKGVIVSSMQESYWAKAFVKAKRVL